jgi:magnesium transporter
MIVDVGFYVEGKRIEGPSDIAHLVEIARARGGYVWIGLAEPTQQEFDQVVGKLNFHPLAVEMLSLRSKGQKSKIMMD